MIKQILYRDTQQGKLFGVCAGWAAFLQQDVGVIRTLTVIFTLFPFTSVLTILSYLVMAWVLDDKPRPVVETVKLNMNQTTPELLDEIEQTLSRLETQITQLEHYVTSESFDFQCKLWTLNATQTKLNL